ncbi:hypothetical protein Taro_006451 [Colocasia esculenta]|uniref:BED-type domain-containing protein n=1 Tax=Colocasia esculenta TaxID=4460 RepID=A0A843U0V0_COLES|nr:hypothetical protein [Colocasia esculenta]
MRDPQGSAGRPHIGRIRFDPPRYADPPRSAPFRYADALRIGTMAPKKAASEDIGWQYGTVMGNRHNYKCNYCGHTGQGGGVSHLKKHLAGGRLAGYHDVQGCKSVPTKVKRLMIEHLKGVRAESQRKKADREMQERIISGRQRDEDDDEEPDVPDVPEQIGSFEVESGSGGSGSRVGGETQSRRYSNIDASAEDVQMASLRIVRPGCEVWDHFVREFRRRYNIMMTWDEFRSFVSRTKSYHLIGELPSESDESVQPQWGTYDPYQQGYWGY